MTLILKNITKLFGLNYDSLDNKHYDSLDTKLWVQKVILKKYLKEN